VLRVRSLLEQYVDAWLFPVVFITAWFYYPYCEHGPVLCFSQLIWHRSCPGCGLTRGICFLVHGRLREAIGFNPLAVVALALMAANFITEIRRISQEVHLRHRS
jgi:hypothetical protein